MQASSHNVEHPFPKYHLRKVAIVVWAAMLVLNDTYLRIRLESGQPTLDWLVGLRLLCAGSGIILGLILLRNRRASLGTGAGLTLAFLVAALASVPFSQFAALSFGYWTLLAGTILLTIGLISHGPSLENISSLETIFLIVLAMCVVKDAGTALMFPEMHTEYLGDQAVTRLGTGVTTPARLGLAAAVSFWGSFKFTSGRFKFPLWLLRAFFLATVLLSRSRVAIICFLIMAFTRYWLLRGFSEPKGYLLRYAIPCLAACMVLAGALFLLFEVPPAPLLLEAFNRGESIDQVMTLTGRMHIWPVVIKNLMTDSVTTIFGHGYGVSEYVIADLADEIGFATKHTHNTVLELFLTMGVSGALIFLAMMLHGGRWFAVFINSCREPLRRLAINGACMMTAVFASSMTEALVARKINFLAMAMILYLVALDPILRLAKTEEAVARREGG